MLYGANIAEMGYRTGDEQHALVYLPGLRRASSYIIDSMARNSSSTKPIPFEQVLLPQR